MGLPDPTDEGKRALGPQSIEQLEDSGPQYIYKQGYCIRVEASEQDMLRAGYTQLTKPQAYWLAPEDLRTTLAMHSLWRAKDEGTITCCNQCYPYVPLVYTVDASDAHCPKCHKTWQTIATEQGWLVGPIKHARSASDSAD